jgi:superfamily I DNA and RNA helicase
LAAYDRLGPFSLKSFTGNYDLLGNPIFTDGDVLVESVYRFKGQSAPCVILTEIDFEELDEIAVRKLFVGATRATMKLILVMSERSATCLLNKV